MFGDFQMISADFSADTPYLNIYPLFDLHIGSSEFNEPLYRNWLQNVERDPFGYVGLGGDLIDNGTLDSRTEVFEAKMRPQEQKEYLYETLKPLKDRILWSHRGNHELRSSRYADNDPIYDVMCWMGIQDRYRRNACFVRVRLGRAYNGKPVVYAIVSTHGASRTKHDKWVNAVDGADVFFSGHVHEGRVNSPGKIKIDTRNGKVSVAPYCNVVFSSFLSYGGYALRGEYLPNGIMGFQRVTLDGRAKKVGCFVGC